MTALSKIGPDGHRYPYSREELRREFPNASFPPDLSGFDLTPYGVLVEPPTKVEAAPKLREDHARSSHG